MQLIETLFSQKNEKKKKYLRMPSLAGVTGPSGVCKVYQKIYDSGLA